MRGPEIGLALLPILQRAALRQIEVVRAPLVGLRLGQLSLCRARRGQRRDQIVLRLYKLAGLDRKERSSLLDHIAEPGDEADDPPRVRGKDRRRQIVVNRNIAFRDAFGMESQQRHGRYLQPLVLRLGGLECARRWSGRRGRLACDWINKLRADYG